MRRCAFLTLEQVGDFVIDDELAVPALQTAGWTVQTIPWQSPEDWAGFDLVVVRSTWDYWDDTTRFLDVLTTIDSQTRLANPLSLMRWNLSKTYLRDLEATGSRIVPTRWVEALEPQHLDEAQQAYGQQGWVLKPQIGANGIDAFLFGAAAELRAGDGAAGSDEGRAEKRTENFDKALARLGERAVMIQPFRRQVLREGEYSLFYFNRVFSHAICKVPLAGEFRSQEERGARILASQADNDLKSAAEKALSALAETPLYARVDLARNDEGQPEVMELELVEPSLYFRMDTAAPARFAAALDDWLARS